MLKSIKFINILSIVILVVVGLLFGIRQKLDLGTWTKLLPHINACFNTATAILLILGLVFIKRKEITAHRWCMTASFVLGGFFLVGYVLYHISNSATHFGGDGFIKVFYYFILITHILCSFAVLPFVLRAMFFALNQDFKAHKKTVKYAFPLWLYVSVTGVIAYLMISPYYN